MEFGKDMASDELPRNKREELCWDRSGRRKDVSKVRTMSAEALTLPGKVFVFFPTKGGRVGLAGRVGRPYPVEELGLTGRRRLAPFKTERSLRDWAAAAGGEAKRWSQLADPAYSLAREREGRCHAER